MATYYWVGGTGTWDNANTTNWSASSGGAGGSGPPLGADNVIFDSASGTGTCTTAATAAGNAVTQNSSTLNIVLGANLIINSTHTLTLGSLNVDIYALSCTGFLTANSNIRTLTFGANGNIVAYGSQGTIVSFTTTNLTVVGTPIVNCTYSGGAGTRTILGGGGTINFNITAGTDSFSTGTANGYGSLNFTGFKGTLTNTSRFISGNLILDSGMTLTAGTNATNFSATSGTQQITTAGLTLDFPLTQNGVGGTVQLQDNLTMGSTRTYTLTNGTLSLVDKTLSTGIFSSSGSTTRSIAFGTGNITLTGNAATIWNFITATNFTYTGTPTVNSTYAGGTGTRNFFHGSTAGATEANTPSFYVSAGSDITDFSNVKTLSFTNFSGTLAGRVKTIYGNLILSSGMTTDSFGPVATFGATSGTQQITTAGVVVNFAITQNSLGATVQLQDNLTMNSARTFTLTAGALDLSSGNRTLSTGLFASSNSNIRTINFGTGNINVTGDNNIVFNMNTATNFSYIGTPKVNFTYSGSVGTRTVIFGTAGGTEANALDFYFTAGSDAMSYNTNTVFGTLDFTGFSGSAFTASGAFVYRNFVLSPTMTSSASTSAAVFAATFGTQQITTNGVTINNPLTFNGIGGTFAFQDALIQGSTRAFTVTNGTVQLKNGVTSTVGAFATSGTNQKFLQSTTPGSQATLSQASGTVDASYLTIRDINATGGATWNAFVNQQNIDAGNNDGWDFGISPIVGSYEYTYQLRSFTQPRRF